MSLVRRLRGEQTEERAADLAYTSNYVSSLGYSSTSSVSVSGAASLPTALGHPTVWRCVNKIAGMYVQMPTKSYRGNDAVSPQPPILVDPSPGMFRLSGWKRAAAVSMLLRGNVYGWASTPDSRGRVERCDLIHPDRVEWDSSRGVWLIDYKELDPDDVWPNGPFWQVPFLTIPGTPKGLNPIEYARRTTYAGLAASEFGGNFFRDGGHPSALLSPETDPGPDGASALKTAFLAATTGTNREPMILPQNVKYSPVQVNPDDSQFIELMQFTGGQVAGFFGLDPSTVGLPAGDSMEYSNRENRQQDVLQDAVMPMVLPLDEGMTALVANGQTVRSTPEGLLRSDLLTRYKSYEIAARIEQATGESLLAVNDEMRPLENRDPLRSMEEEAS